MALTDAAEEEGEEAPPPKKKPAKKPAAKKSAAKPRAKKATPKIEPTNEDVAIHEQDKHDETPKIPAARRGKLTPKKLTSGRRAKPTVEEDDEADAAEATPATATAPVPVPVSAPVPVPAAASDDDSELSELEDEPPKKPAKRARVTTNASPKKPTPKRPKAKPTVKEESDAEEAAPQPPAAVATVDNDNELSDADEPPTKKPGKRSLGASAKSASPKKKAKVALKASPKDEGKTEAAEEPKEQEERSSTPAADDAGSDSEMSVVLDPTPKKGRSSGIGKVSAPKKTKSPRAPAGRKPKAKKADVSRARYLSSVENKSLTPRVVERGCPSGPRTGTTQEPQSLAPQMRCMSLLPPVLFSPSPSPFSQLTLPGTDPQGLVSRTGKIRHTPRTDRAPQVHPHRDRHDWPPLRREGQENQRRAGAPRRGGSRAVGRR